MLQVAAFFALLSPLLAWSPGDSNPNIILIFADDLGFNDVPWNNEDLVATNLASMAEKGVVFNKFYTHSSCSPSRAALMTGYYPIHNGFYKGALGALQKAGLETQYKTIAEHLNDLNVNYANHMLGKWHLGWCNNDYLPHHRGFDSFYGILHSGAGHWDYMSIGTPYAWELFDGDNVADIAYANQTYSSELYAAKATEVIDNHADNHAGDPLFLYLPIQSIHTPREYPDDIYTTYYAQASGINRNRKQTSAMITAMDEFIGDVLSALEARGMLSNSIVIFASDNGGQPKTGGASNWPLRGGKNMWYEGGIRVPSMIYSPLFENEPWINTTTDCNVHVTDWLPTILTLAGGDPSALGLDGIDQWQMITSGGQTCDRTEIVHSIVVDGRDNLESAAITIDEMKLIISDVGDGGYDGWYEVDGTEHVGYSDDTYYLYDLINDPYEQNNLYGDSSYDADFTKLSDRVDELIAEGIIGYTAKGTISESVAVVDERWQLQTC